jgi:N-acetylglucosaminyldiphosphoundecaprenol N-acetyl-beta-D-mannosaminyltransferase
MLKKVILKDIVFNNLKHTEFRNFIKTKGYFVFPSAPGLSSIEIDKEYYNALVKSDLVFFDSGFFVLLLRIFKNIKAIKFSGFKFLEIFFKYLKKNNHLKILCIDPNEKFSISNARFLKNLKVKKIYNYIAPIYNPKKINDRKLLKLINEKKPDFILNNLGGGTQEILALYLKKKMKIKSTILCTGGAISFFTGDQAPINHMIDKFYLGWFVRLIYNPFTFFKRYLLALRLIKIVFNNKIKPIHEQKYS